MKEAADEEVREAAGELLGLCRQYGATLIIDDRVGLVGETGADGVHLGKKDMPIKEARQLLGDKIIGGTANTLADIKLLIDEGVDYIGLGPYRFTRTKANLSPIVGEEGYRTIMRDLCQQGLHKVPIVAIGGILASDITLLKDTGVDGIAVSGAILNASDPREETRRMVELLNETGKRYEGKHKDKLSEF